MPDLFTLEELGVYAGDDYDDTRGPLIRELTLGAVYDTIPDAVADPSPRARAIALEVAGRALRNPQGYAAERVDDYSYNRPSATQAAGVYLTDGERSELLDVAAAAAGVARSRVRSVRLRSASGPW